ncbi:PspC domain-containing protein [Microbacterium sp. ARD31]|uniref:ATP-binding protein n=1 Tax=Microbacterium sp. ARD31 TaxID=2962576 RepID=UPI002880E8F3|nr:PspC domain-containing protein [Microbacterium sp. ARD31]MDT0185262.1 PspC domain-containing protein [Microbacterium sp. ARD31]
MSDTTPRATPAPAPAPTWRAAQPRRAYRDLSAPVAGGVASGLAAHLAVPVLWVRVFFVATALLGGFGLMLYAGLWVFLPADQGFEVSAPGLESATRTGKRPGRRSRLRDAGPAIAIGALLFGVVLGFEGIFGQGALFWPVVLGIAGIGLLWRQADEAQRERWIDSSGRIDPFRAVFGNGGWAAYTRFAAGLGLILTALIVFAVAAGKATFAVPVLVAGLLGLVGLAIVVGPWAMRLIDDLGAERAERVRTQERADMAAHLHDSVLQTLALIQKNAHDSTTVARLARSQERDLRQWLFEADTADATTLAGALKEMAADVEAQHPVVVDVVTVGDCDLDESLRPVVLAAREAVVNVAKHAGTQRADVYAETTAGAVDVFVRDRGEGFDVAGVAADRQGVRSSIVDRMARHGGSADVRSAPGEGTEVRLHMPRSQARSHSQTPDEENR